MKKLVIILAAVVAIAAITAAILTRTTAGQDALMSRALSATMGAAPEAVEHLRVVVCGSASPLGASMDRAQACIAVQTPDHFLLFDVGARSPVRMRQAQLPMGSLDAVFITHFHSDHIAALPDVNLQSWVGGRKASLEVYGPRGIDRVVDGFNMAYSLDRGYRTAHHGEAMLPPVAGPMTAKTFNQEGVVWEDSGLTVTAFRVSHHPIDPAVGYRVDYEGRSVVISGDSITDDNLFKFADGADLLLHDALSRALLDPMIAAATEANVPVMPTIMTDVIDYHADSLRLEERAQQAGIGKIAYYHLVPAPPNSLAERIFARGLDDDTLLVKDLHTFDLPEGSTDIVIREP